MSSHNLAQILGLESGAEIGGWGWGRDLVSSFKTWVWFWDRGVGWDVVSNARFLAEVMIGIWGFETNDNVRAGFWEGSVLTRCMIKVGFQDWVWVLGPTSRSNSKIKRLGMRLGLVIKLSQGIRVTIKVEFPVGFWTVVRVVIRGQEYGRISSSGRSQVLKLELGLSSEQFLGSDKVRVRVVF
ncbi:hypothetical protein TIFTF001_006926 [Ficus carica]|uniref:Uncharacterized protein n=1 Tax=Ficus carica TaxID=3494 RepID=A0AA88A5A5_FICCA|nr:hypothetical protein TIFTF001_006926 [Ficus carica]